MNSSRERNQPDYLLNRPAAVNTKHRRTQSNMTTLKAPMSVLQQQSVQRSDLNGHIRIGLQDSKGLLGVSKTQDERGTVPVAPSYPEMETYSAKRLKTLGLLQTSLQTNLTRFISLIEESRSSYARKSTNSLKSQILRIIGDLSSYGYGDNRKAAELIRSLEELFYEHQSKTDALISTKDSNYQFITNEANTFAQITLKISNELNLQIGSLKRKLGIFFQSLQHDDIEDHSIRQTIPAEGLQTNFSEAKPKQRVTMPTSMYMSAPNGKHDQGRQVLLTTDHQFHNSSDDKEGNPSLATSHKFFGSNGSDRIDYASPFKDHTGSDYSHKEVMSRLQHKFKSLEDDLLERWKTSQDRVSELEGRTRRLWDKVQEKDQEKLMLTESVATKSEEILNLTRQNTLLHLHNPQTQNDLKTQAEIMQNKLKIQDVFINNQNESMVQSSKAACESKQLWMKEKLECESLRVQCETLKVDLQQAKAAISPLQTMISGLQNALQQSEKKAQAQEIETQRLEVALKEETSKLAEETKAVESLQEKTKVLDVCSASLATLKQELEQKCSKVESLETALVQALKQREIEAKTLPQTPANAETAIEAPRPPIVEAPTVPTKIVTASAPHDQGDASEHLAKIDLLEKQIKELKDQFNTKENDLYQRIKELQSKLQDEKTRAEHFKFDFEETKEKLLTANVTISEYRNSKSALQSQLTDVIAERNLTNKIVVEKDTLIFQLKMHFAILADLLRKNGIRKNPDSDEPEKLSDGELVDVIERYIEQRLKYWLIINL